MNASGIYYKPCPACGALAPTDAKRCRCNHTFDQDDTDNLSPEEQTAREEELFEAYINARVDQTLAAVEAARTELMADPKNLDKAARLLQTMQAALALRDERDAQAIKTTEAKQTALEAKGVVAQPSTTLPAAHPTGAFKAQQAAKAARVMQAFANTQTKECPHCKTVLPVTSALCLCGYIFASNSFLPQPDIQNVARLKKS